MEPLQVIGETKSAGWGTDSRLNEALLEVGGEGLGDGVGEAVGVGLLEWADGVAVADGEVPVHALTRRMSAAPTTAVPRCIPVA
jgi:hypothetical protein